MFGQIDFDLLLDSVVQVWQVYVQSVREPTFSNGHNSAIFEAMDLKFCMEVHIDDL